MTTGDMATQEAVRIAESLGPMLVDQIQAVQIIARHLKPIIEERDSSPQGTTMDGERVAKSAATDIMSRLHEGPQTTESGIASIIARHIAPLVEQNSLFHAERQELRDILRCERGSVGEGTVVELSLSPTEAAKEFVEHRDRLRNLLLRVRNEAYWRSSDHELYCALRDACNDTAPPVEEAEHG
jgi:hypothetical protein